MPDTKIRNPFIHSHDHDHDHNGHVHGDGEHHHHHGGDDFEPTDPAQQSLADALRVSFAALKWIMVLLLVAYLFTGIFRVDDQHRAVRLRFGAIVGQPGQQVYPPGWHFGLPYPIEQKIMVPVVRRTVDLNRAFWFEAPAGSAGQSLDQMRGGPLNPERDGSLLTADASVVHGRFAVDYTITDPARYVQNVGNLALAEALVRNAAEQGIVFAVAQTPADEVIRRNFSQAAAVQRMQDVLDEMETGISVIPQSFTMGESTMPLPVRPAYQAVINAQSERAALIEEARQERTQILNETAGEAYEPLFELVQEYELAAAAGDTARAEELSTRIDEAFDTLAVPIEAGGLVPIGGQAAALISAAQTDRVQTVEQVKAEANTFRSLLERYRQNPQLVKTQLWQDAREEIFTSEEIETVYAATDGHLTITTNRDPAVAREREQRRLREQQEAVRQQPGQ